MLPGMNPKQMAQAMKAMGIKQKEIAADKVVIKKADGNIVISNGSFVRMPGMKVELKSKTQIFEIEIFDSSFKVLTGEIEQLKHVFIGSK